MITLSSAIEKLSAVAKIVPEYENPNVFSEEYEDLLKSYPRLKDYSDYLEFLRRTGGSHIYNEDFSLGIYGFGGYVVASFDEGVFLDAARYFQFGEVLYTQRPEPIYFFAFDLQSEQDRVYSSPNARSEYTFCSSSFVELLLEFANGKYPAS
ncbi:MAG: hypothetical protein ACREQW_20190 [Candidatus Binatia bacterium]